MSLVASLNVGVSALKTYSQGIQVISNNIANVSTTAYKSSRTSYSDQFSNLLKPLVPNQASGTKVPPTQIGGGVQVQGINSVFSQGTVQTTGSVSDLALVGAGFFRVRDVEAMKDYVTRAGNFRVSTDGALATQDGYRVQGVYGAATRVIVSAGRFDVMNAQDTMKEKKITASTTIKIKQSQDNNLSFDVGASSLLEPLSVGMSVFKKGGGGTIDYYGTVQKIEGSLLTVSGFRNQGNMQPSTVAFAPETTDSTTGVTTPADSLVFNQVFLKAVSGLDSGDNGKAQLSNGVATNVVFGIPDGGMWPETISVGQDLMIGNESFGFITQVDKVNNRITVIPKNFNANVSVNSLYGLDGGYKEAEQIGDVKVEFNPSSNVTVLDASGSAVKDFGSLPGMKSFNIGPSGEIIVNLSNGQTFMSGRVLVQNFKDPNSLIRQGNNLYSGIENAGAINSNDLDAVYNRPGSDGLGLIQSGSLEMSNVDLGQEFAEMITTQRSFQAGSRVISVSDQMLEEVVNLKR